MSNTGFLAFLLLSLFAGSGAAGATTYLWETRVVSASSNFPGPAVITDTQTAPVGVLDQNITASAGSAATGLITTTILSAGDVAEFGVQMGGGMDAFDVAGSVAAGSSQFQLSLSVDTASTFAFSTRSVEIPSGLGVTQIAHYVTFSAVSGSVLQPGTVYYFNGLMSYSLAGAPGLDPPSIRPSTLANLTITPVPEPSSAMLTLAGTLGVLLVARFRAPSRSRPRTWPRRTCR